MSCRLASETVRQGRTWKRPCRPQIGRASPGWRRQRGVPVPLPQALEHSSPGGHTLPTGDVQRTPATRTDRRAPTLPPAVVDRAVVQPLEDGAIGAERSRTAWEGEATGSSSSHRDRTAPVPASAPSGRIHPRASGEDGPRAERVAPEASSPVGRAPLPRMVPGPLIPPRASGMSTTEVRPASSPGDRSMTAPDSRSRPVAAAEATQKRMAGAAPENWAGHEKTRSSPIGPAGEPARAAAVMPLRPGQPTESAGGSAGPQLLAPAPGPGIKDEGRRFKAPIVPAMAPEPHRLPTAALSAETVSITIGSVELRAPPAPAPALAARAAAVATPRLSLDDYLRNRRGRQP